MKITRLQLGGVSLYTIIICFFSYLVATRDYSIGTDTLNYYQYFLNVDFYNGSQYQHEMGFHYLVLIVYKLTKSYTFFLFVFNILINIVYIKSMTNFIDNKNKDLYILAYTIFLGLLLSSSWYQVATLNGLRQGISLALLYLSLSYLYLNKNLLFVIFLVISLSFHNSTFLIAPFLILYYFRIRVFLFIFTIIALFYPLGINELIVKNFSNMTGFSVYSMIANYAEGVNLWRGFQIPFYIYSVFWCGLFLFIHLKYFKTNQVSEFLLKTLLILTSAYFLFGFGDFSNRFGFFSWLFLPIIQTFYLASFVSYYTRNRDLIFLIATISVLYGIYNFYYVLRPVI